uniref:A-kinase anchor protein 7-like n=1 Tax=Erpetoichthys calabaricus TaxID=27687 RepID=A0A8C4TJ37_ERPCA
MVLFSNTLTYTRGFNTVSAFILVKISERRQKKKRKRTLGDETEDDSDKKKKKKHLRPNYFISVPITNPKIHASIKAIQTLIIEEDDRYTKAMIPLSTLHMTLLVTYLSSEEEVNIAISVIKEVKESIQRILQGEPLLLPFHGIGHFRNEVVFVKMVEAEDFLKHMAAHLEFAKRAFEEKGILAGDSKDFKPHLTFMKLSRAPKLRSQGIKKLDPKLYKNFENQNFGNEKLVNLDLCSMLKKKQPNGYYHCEASITVGKLDCGMVMGQLECKPGTIPGQGTRASQGEPTCTPMHTQGPI